MKNTMIGVDLAKSVFVLHGASLSGKQMFRKKLSRPGFLKFMAEQAPAVVVMEACGGANYWAREMVKLGYEVMLIALNRDWVQSADHHTGQRPLSRKQRPDRGAHSITHQKGQEPLAKRAATTEAVTVKTFKRDYVRINPTPGDETVMAQLPSWFEHYYNIHPHKALGYQSPREFLSRNPQS